MNKKFILIIILIVVVGVFIFLASKDSEPGPPVEPVVEDEIGILDLLTELKEETGLGFSKIEPVMFKWVLEVDPRVQEITIGGQSFEVSGISSEQYDSVSSFLIDRGFELDLYNMTDATFVGMTGYKKDRIVCTVSGGASGYEETEGQWIPPEIEINDIEVRCGELYQPVGGERDEYGCLGAAGYGWNEEVNACIRGWELTVNQREAARIAVDYIGYENGVTIIQVQTARCPGCFMVEIEKGIDRIKVTLENYEVVERSMTPDECAAKEGTVVNITGGATCDSDQVNIGDVTGFISPAICCVSAQ